MKVLIDMNMSAKWVEALRGHGLDVVHWSALGDPASPDDEIMRHAATHGYVVLTRDMDFSAILAATKGTAPSVVHLRRQDRFSEELAAVVASAMRQVERELGLGAVLSLNGSRMRLRPLPIGSVGIS